MVRNSIYVGRVESPDYGVSARGDFEPLIDKATFYRVQAVLDGRVVVAGPRPRNHPDFPLRGFVRCETCGRPLTGSWSKGRNGYYAYYHCQPQCRAVNVSKTKLEGLFAEELGLLQPTPGYMRLVKDRVLYVWQQRTSEVKDRATEVQQRARAVQQKLDRLDEAFLYAQTIDLTSYERQRDKLREELTLAQIDHHAESIEEIDVQGILAFAKCVLPRAADLWVQASLSQKQRWTVENRQFMDRAKPAISPGRPRPVSSTSFLRRCANPSALSSASSEVRTSARAVAPDPVRTAYCDAGLRLIGGTMPTAR